ncbi:hypothetical protein GCM10027275_01390 [Rhabdobacter roseus]|uniref:Cell shape-determining protein MreB n=1 Tax=Rhabdobacter roseus TaxID=1655419 RepID=A0A840TLC6_9BACT|nr:Ig-like domain repeat protein [Rhabdobacter roseus]MBB5282023.1 hypothetical protein [Rhabdobacter roseus]
MKRQSTLRSLFTFLLASSLLFTFNACKEDEEIGPAPTVSAGSGTQGIPGATVQISASINAPEGIQSLTVLKNGQQWDTKTYPAGTTSDNYAKDYVVEQLPVNSVVTFTFQATDSRNQTSTLATQTLTVSALPAKQVVDVQGVLEGNITWTKDKIYKLIGFVRVGEDPTVDGQPTKTGTLTIQPGTLIIGDRASKATLVVQRGSKIIAEGTAAEPIVFTSERPVGEREPGDWGGLVICGKATNNQPNGVFQLEGGYGAFSGGNDDNDNSGSLKYVRVEYAGVPINPNQEVNSFTFGSVGKATKMEYLQASFGLDDSFEWFGGTSDAKYLISWKGYDDDFDVDFGYRGNVQYAIAVRGNTLADQSGSNGFEVDNNGQGTLVEPFTSGTFSNVSIIGPKVDASTAISAQFQNGMHLRRSNKLKIYNTVVVGFPNGIFIDGSSTQQFAASGDLVLNRVVIAGVEGWGSNNFGLGSTPGGYAVRDVNTAATPAPITIGTQTPSAWFLAQPGNKIHNSYANLGLNPAIFTNNPNFLISTSASQTLATGGQAPAGSFFTATDFIGAFKDQDWTAGWAEFNPQAEVYR